MKSVGWRWPTLRPALLLFVVGFGFGSQAKPILEYRKLQLLVHFKTLWWLVQGLMTSCGTTLSALALLFFVIYVFACNGREVITKQDGLKFHDDEVVRANIEDIFSTLPVLMLTLTQFVTLDSVAGIYGPLVTTAQQSRGRKKYKEDWQCPTCWDWQFARNSRCRWCGGDRPGQAGRGRSRGGPAQAGARWY